MNLNIRSSRTSIPMKRRGNYNNKFLNSLKVAMKKNNLWNHDDPPVGIVVDGVIADLF